MKLGAKLKFLLYINYYIEIWGRNVQGVKRPIEAKRPGAKRPGVNRPGGETSRGENGFGAKRPGTVEKMLTTMFDVKYYKNIWIQV